jgi:hypothetical protein
LKAVAVDSLVTVSSGVELACEIANDREHFEPDRGAQGDLPSTTPSSSRCYGVDPKLPEVSSPFPSR